MQIPKACESTATWGSLHPCLHPQISHSDGRQSVALARQALQSKTLPSQDPVNQCPPPLSSLYVFHFQFKLKKASSKRHNPIHSYIFVLTDQDYVPTVTSEWLFLFVLYIYLFSDMQLKCLDPSFCMYCISQREWFKACRSVSKSICIKICLQWACFTQSGSWREWDNDLSEVWENASVQSLWVWVNHAGESSGFCKSRKWKGVPAAGWKNKQTNTNISFKPAWLPLNFHIYFSLFNIFYTYVFSTDFLLLELLIIFSNTAQQIEKLRNFSIW